MNISIKSFFTVVAIFNLILLLLIILNLLEMKENHNSLVEIEHNRYLMIQKADELRQSSDDLTRFARSYAVTLDQKYKENFDTTLKIRNGEAPRPEHYEWVYWDLVEPLRSLLHPLGEEQSLKSQMYRLPYAKQEIKYLEESENNSNELVKIEVEAFNALKGLFKDENGKYTVQKEPDQQHAIELLYSFEYNRAKERIMYPINMFLESINKRTEDQIDDINFMIKSNINNVFYLFIFDIIVIVITWMLVAMNVLKLHQSPDRSDKVLP
ncbi:MAG: hypothetical protein R3302_01760 [Sulfurimonadaceae bacterium]|nr:hypothetical protein [Sulfurimonadaceae bacterium]